MKTILYSYEYISVLRNYRNVLLSSFINFNKHYCTHREFELLIVILEYRYCVCSFEDTSN